MIRALALFVFPITVFAFTLNPNTGKGFKKSTIEVSIASTSCDGAGFSTSEYKKMIQEAVNEYWHSVATSSLYLDIKDVTDIDIAGDSFSSALAKVPVNTILAGCNTSAEGFNGDGSSSTTLGAAVMTCSSDDCKAVLILNAHEDSLLPTLSRDDIKATIAHEIGHAFGLGHSEYEYSLMYYSAGGKVQKWLGIDDIDGVTYLYPHDAQLGGLLGSCATISTANEKQNFFLSFAIGLFIIALFTFKRRIISYIRFGHRP